MAVNIAHAGGRRRRGGRYRGGGAGRQSEINVTPMVDVMLVLLIVFMVAAPLLTVGVPVDLPKTQAGALGDDSKEPLQVSVMSDGGVFLQDQPIALDEIVPRLTAIAENDKDVRVFVRADKSVDYGKVMEVMGLLSAAGFTRIGLVTEQAPAEAQARAR